MSNLDIKETLKAKVFTLMVLRVVFAFIFLGVTAWYQNSASFSLVEDFNPLYLIVAIIGSVTIIYALVLNKVANLQLFTYIQITIDILVISLLIYMTGGVESYLSIMYFFAIITGSIFFGINGGSFGAILSTVTYVGTLYVDYKSFFDSKFQLFSPSSYHSWEETVLTALTNTLGFIIVAFLTGYITEKSYRFERELKAKGVDLRKLEELNTNIVENITSGIVTLDNKGLISSFNKSATDITGYKLVDVYHRPFVTVFPDFLESADESRSKNILRSEGLVLNSDGKEIIVGYLISPGQSDEAASIVIFSDLTDTKIMEEQLKRDERLKSLGELSASIAHEIRNPLASISGSVQLLKGSVGLEGDNKRLMEIVLREIDRINSLTSDFLLFARPAQKNRERINVTLLLNETLDVFKNSVDVEKINVINNTEGEFFIDCDRGQISQVLWNLLINASNSIEDNGVIVATINNSTEQYVSIKITDNGCGISEEHLKNIFDPFYSTKAGGTGLGLALVHRIIESHGGTISVTSTKEGTVFEIKLPVATIIKN